jgi:hypothetical protein
MLAAGALSALAPHSVRIATAQTAAQTEKMARTEPEIDRPLKWLISAQNDNGGWGDGVKTAPDVATTALSGIALIRMGHTAGAGTYSKSTRKAVDFVVEAIEKTPQNEVDINAAGTLPQRKLGRHIDTFLGAQFLAEALPGYPEGAARVRVRNALDKVVDKVQRACSARSVPTAATRPTAGRRCSRAPLPTTACTRPARPARASTRTRSRRAIST